MKIFESLNKHVNSVKTLAVFIGGIVAGLLAFSKHYEENFSTKKENETSI